MPDSKTGHPLDERDGKSFRRAGLPDLEREPSDFLKELLGPSIFNNYLSLKMADWEEHRTHVTPLEHRKYLSI
ncbi:MAG: glutamine synthetase [Desulfuromonadales bacterium]|jgi:glutamine synthetase|nr:glutamine synthetase [Desulfuromonadales bacterium]MDH4025762.1 glutamine synthetase [Desulfuromonadales bacterium]HKJ29241.1 hypothetical protein [Desulfuromonadales bacterium]